MNVETRFGTESPVVGMVHLPPLPGSPRYDGDRASIRERAVTDARTLEAGGVDAVLVENFGDAPFYPDEVPSHTVADVSVLSRAVVEAVDVPVGVNVLRNDVDAALSAAAAAGGSFVRVNVHVGSSVTDQGVIEGRAFETMRERERLDADVAVLADVDVKHATPHGGRPLAERVADVVERGLADGVVVSGSGTGRPADADTLAAVRATLDEVAPETPLFVGSGVTEASVAETFAVADGAIVGTAFKPDGDVDAPVAEDRVRALVDAAGE
ncbi:BtpA/SgcQ family protein [Halorubellus sp. JP-L1]|uniref:BtpA/SgcQ family protein n=1 Tax=Halorubellus sp. JP-L1 TaxID=2715753 RepID=UPI00140E6226|nr:BtpA/SgcQ family protein [Halorubellus sp. JP-L1]NHN40486.1 BtpA/SgcQ family protein [Halorubellus sp. JP-L1]